MENLVIIIGFKGKSTPITLDTKVKTSTIEELYAKVSISTGLNIEQLKLHFNSKQLESKSPKGETYTMEDYDITAVVPIFYMNLSDEAELKLKTSIYESRRGGEYFGNDKIKRNLIINKGRKEGDCQICYETGYMLDCGDFTCNDCFLDHVWTKLRAIEPVECFSCDRIFSTKEILEFGQPSKLEAKFISIAASINAIDNEDYIACPTCKSFVEPMSKNDKEIICIICKTCNIETKFCWLCKKKWLNPDSHRVCGNVGCDTAVTNIVSIALTRTKHVLIEDKKIPHTRKCPSCNSLVEWEKACNSVLCKCGIRFCISCLVKANKGDTVALCGSIFYKTSSGNIQCDVAPIQN